MKHSSLPALVVGLAMALSGAAAFAEEPAATPQAAVPVEKLDRVREEQIEADKAAAGAQQRINQIDDETQKMLVEYRRAMADTESHQAYAAQLTRQVESQQGELAEIQRQLDEVENTSRAIVPLEQKMLATLKEFVRLDIPFLLEERTTRVGTLEEMMNRADVSISEKYRRIVEAYQVEMDYGRTIESYEGHLAGDSAPRTARFLRVGRVALLYQTLDGEETGFWDNRNRKWQVDQHYAHAFTQGVAVARKLSAPEMLEIPVPAPEESKS
jgi:Skp family chaperone for outer membrane proteins